jgi:hypothetical protein
MRSVVDVTLGSDKSAWMVGFSRSMMCVAVGIATASAAIAQERSDCAIYDELLSAAPAGFEAFKGELVAGTTNAFQSRKMLGSMYCVVGEGETPAFVCVSDEMTEARTRRAYDLRLSALRACFEGWETAPFLDVPGPIQTAEALRFIKHADGGLLSIGAAVGFTEVDGAIQWRVGFGVSWKPDDIAV